MVNKCAKWVRQCSVRQCCYFVFYFLLGNQHNMRHCLFFQGKRFSLARPAVNHMTRLIWLKIISRSLPVPKVLRTCLHRLRWLLKCVKETSEMQRCILGGARHWCVLGREAKKKKKRSSNPLEVRIRVTPPLCGFSSSFSFFKERSCSCFCLWACLN